MERTLLLFLVPLRLACGYLLAAGGLAKVLSGWLINPLLAVRINEWLRTNPASLGARVLAPLLRHMQHHAQIYSVGIAVAEFVCGAALIGGLFSRYAAVGGFLLVLLPLLAAGKLGLGPSSELVVCAALLSLSLSGSGRAFGLDRLLQGHVPPWLC